MVKKRNNLSDSSLFLTIRVCSTKTKSIRCTMYGQISKVFVPNYWPFSITVITGSRLISVGSDILFVKFCETQISCYECTTVRDDVDCIDNLKRGCVIGKYERLYTCIS